MDQSLGVSIAKIVTHALEEDIGSGDVTANLINQAFKANAKIISREQAIICGIPWANEVFNQVDNALVISWNVNEGDQIEPEQILCTIEGCAANILTAERTALNFLQTLSATATTTRKYADLIQSTTCKILDTRKTIPGLRLAQKYAVTTGGGYNHRIGLYDGVLIKENHIYASGSLENAIEQAYARHGESMMIEVEVETLDELKKALAAGAKRIMLDNFDLDEMIQAVGINQSRAELEASGNISQETLYDTAMTGIDYISLGALTKHIQAIDLSLLFEFKENQQI